MNKIQLIKRYIKIKKFILTNKCKSRFRSIIQIDNTVFLSSKCTIIVENGGSLIIGKNCYISDFSRIVVHKNAKLIIENNVYISINSLISSNSYVKIENDCSIAHFVTIIDTNHRFNNKNMNINQQGGISKPIIIKEDCWISTGVVVLYGVTIGRHSVIAANAVVNKNLPPFVVAGGVPCKIIKSIE